MRLGILCNGKIRHSCPEDKKNINYTPAIFSLYLRANMKPER